MRAVAVVIAVSMGLGCGFATRQDRVTDFQTVCLVGPDTVRATFRACYSSSCGEVIAESCAVALDGTEAVITGFAEIETTQMMSCTDDCRAPSPICTGSLGDATRIRAGSMLFDRELLAISSSGCVSQGDLDED